jgi:hypothetical protein
MCCEFASNSQDTSTVLLVDIQSRLRAVGLELVVTNDTDKEFVTPFDGDEYIKNENISSDIRYNIFDFYFNKESRNEELVSEFLFILY